MQVTGLVRRCAFLGWLPLLAALAVTATLPVVAEAQSGTKTTFQHPTGEYAIPLPAGWKQATFADEQGGIGVVLGPVVEGDHRTVARGIWIYLVPISSDEYVSSQEMVEFAEALLKQVHSGEQLDRDAAREVTWGGVQGTAWPVASAVGGVSARRGEVRMIVLRDALLVADWSVPAANGDADSPVFTEVLGGLRLTAKQPRVAAVPQNPERSSQIAARYKASVPQIHAKARRDSAPASGEPAPVESLEALSSGTGFVVSADGYVITNRHVIERNSDDGVTRFHYDPVTLTWDPVARTEEDVADVVAVSRQWDLALLKIRGTKQWTPFPMADMSQVHEAQQVLVIGWPDIGSNSSDLLHHNSNVIAGLERDAKLRTRVLRHGARTTSGNSGGPVYGLEAGGIVGVHSRGYISEAKKFKDIFQHGAVPVDRLLWEFPQVFCEPEGELSLEERLARAEHYFRQERFGAATLECRRILEKSPQNGLAHAYLYRIQRLQNEVQFAETHFPAAIADPASRVLAHVLAARSAQEEGDITLLGKHSAQAAIAARELKQDDQQADLMLAYSLSSESLFGIAFESSGGQDCEARTMQGAARLRSWLIDHPATRLGAETKIPSAEAQEIGKILQHSLRLWLIQPRAFVYRALLLALNNQPQDAYNAAQVARAIGGHDPEILIVLAYYHLLADEVEQALVDSVQAVRTRATLPATYLLGAACVRYANLLESYAVDSPDRRAGFEVLEDLKLPTDPAQLKTAGAELVAAARQDVRNRMAKQINKSALLGWWDFAILLPHEK